MTFKFKLEVVKVECGGEESFEVGKDEMRLFGVGVSRLGSVFTTGVRKIGSYGDGDVNMGSFPMTLFETKLPDNGLEVLFHVWLIEEDGGGVRGAEDAIEATFRDEFKKKVALLTSVNFPRECIPFAAFDKALPAVQNRMEIAATKGRDDAIFFPNDRFLKFEAGPLTPHSSTLSQITTSTHGALYHVTFRHTYDKLPAPNLPD